MGKVAEHGLPADHVGGTGIRTRRRPPAAGHPGPRSPACLRQPGTPGPRPRPARLEVGLLEKVLLHSRRERRADRGCGRADQRRGQPVDDHHVTNALRREQAPEVHRAAGQREPDGVCGDVGRARTRRRQHLRGVGQVLGGERERQAWLASTIHRRAGPAGPRARAPVPRPCWAGRGTRGAAPPLATAGPTGPRQPLRRREGGRGRPGRARRTLTSCRQPNSLSVRSFSSAEMPKPTHAATASAAGASTTVSEGANEPMSPL